MSIVIGISSSPKQTMICSTADFTLLEYPKIMLFSRSNVLDKLFAVLLLFSQIGRQN